MNVVFVGSHPDDIELGCGGTISKHVSKKDDVFILVLTKGERGGHSWCFLEKSMKVLSIKKQHIKCMEVKDGSVCDDVKTISDIEFFLNQNKIERVYTHSLNETHQDHRKCHLATLAASRRINQILFYEGPSTISMKKNFFVDIKEIHLQKKIKALKCYIGQYPKSFDIKVIESQAIANGFLMNRKHSFAEAFEVGKYVEV